MGAVEAGEKAQVKVWANGMLPAVTESRYKGTEQQRVGNGGFGDWPKLGLNFRSKPTC